MKGELRNKKKKMMTSKLTKCILWFGMAFVLVIFIGCDSNMEENRHCVDVPVPVETVAPTITTSGFASLGETGGDQVEVNVAGFFDAVGMPVDQLVETDFTLVEDMDCVKAITLEKSGSDARPKADVAFVLDTSASMGDGLTGIQSSISAFVDTLVEEGLDLRLGAITFGDTFDIKEESSTRTGISIQGLTTIPTDLDPSERPSFSLTDDITAFKTFIGEESPRSSGPRGSGDFTENAMGALEFAFDVLDWRTGAQRILIVITDNCAHTESSQTHIVSPWTPSQPETVLQKLKGQAVVHAINPDVDCSDSVNMRFFTGPSGTGGVYVEWDLQALDLTQLPIANLATSGYVLTYTGYTNRTSHSVRVVIDDGNAIQGEVLTTATY